jgi:hypothetical protein
MRLLGPSGFHISGCLAGFCRPKGACPKNDRHFDWKIETNDPI